MKIGDMIEELHQMREQIRSDEAALKELKKQFDEKQWNVIALMEELGLDQAKSNSATVFVAKDTLPTVKDWEKLTNYIKENDAHYLFQKRITQTAWKELIESGQEVPGVEPFEQTKLNMRSN